ncbi:MAG TPA: thioredoxin domain-containing protein [Novosphingobium sp.]|nr:thioredoxin domain-containing protein [Novosphingobium sp.]
MTKPAFRLFRAPSLPMRAGVLAIAALPLALGLAGCKKGAEATGSAAATTAPATLPAGKSWTDIVVATPEGGMQMGNPNAPVKLVEYGSLSCPHCAKLAQESMAQLTGNYVKSGKVSYEYRSFAIHPQDIPLTVLVRCAGPDAYFGMVEQIYGNFDAMQDRLTKGIDQAKTAQNLPPAQRYPALADALGYTEFFQARGLPADQQHKCLADLSAAEKVAKESETISNAGINSTPTLMINGNKIPALTWPELETALKSAGA